MDEDHTVKIFVDDMKVRLETKATMIPKYLVEQIITEVLKETQDRVPKSKVENGLRGYLEYLEHSRNLWRVTALVISTLFFLTSILRLIK